TRYLKFKETATANSIAIKNNGYTSESGMYTHSGFLKVDGGLPSESYFKDINNRGSSDTKIRYQPSSGYFAITQTITDYSWTSHASVANKSGRTVELSDIKYEKGSTATPYTPAPEDVKDNIQSVNDFDIISQKATVNGESAIDGIEVGGRNLVLGSDVITTSSQTYFEFINDLKDLAGETITVSVFVEYENVEITSTTGGQRIGFEPAITFSDGTTLYMGVWKYPNKGDSFSGRITKTITVPNKEIVDI